MRAQIDWRIKRLFLVYFDKSQC